MRFSSVWGDRVLASPTLFPFPPRHPAARSGGRWRVMMTHAVRNYIFTLAMVAHLVPGKNLATSSKYDFERLEALPSMVSMVNPVK